MANEPPTDSPPRRVAGGEPHGWAHEPLHPRGADRLTAGDALTIVVRLPQPLETVAALLRRVAELWPDAVFTDGLSRLVVPPDDD